MSKNRLGRGIEQLYLGVDVGNGYTKARKIKFPSRVTLGVRSKSKKKAKNTYDIRFDGQEYIVGAGSEFTGDSRYFTLDYKLCLLTAIANNFPKTNFIDIVVCVGLPVENYDRLSEKLTETFDGTQHIITIVNDEVEREVTIRFKEFIVYIEGAYPTVIDQEERSITIDMGAGTINVVEMLDGDVVQFATYPDSMLKLYQEIATHLNVTKGGKFLPIDIEPILNKDETIIDSKLTDITDIKPMIQSHINAIASRINNSFNVSRSYMYLIGGGCMDTAQYWTKAFPNAKAVEDGQSANSKAFDIVARIAAEGEEEEDEVAIGGKEA